MDDFIEMALKLEADLTTATLEWNEAVERNIEYCGALFKIRDIEDSFNKSEASVVRDIAHNVIERAGK
jgi:hypothetical protein